MAKKPGALQGLTHPKKGINKEYKDFSPNCLNLFWGMLFLKNLVWTQFWHPGTWKFGFLVENYPYSVIPRSKLVNPGQNTSFAIKNRVLKLRFLAFPDGPGGFRELREAGRNHFHLSWYLLVPGVTSHDQKTTIRGSGWSPPLMGFYLGILIKWSPP